MTRNDSNRDRALAAFLNTAFHVYRILFQANPLLFGVLCLLKLILGRAKKLKSEIALLSG